MNMEIINTIEHANRKLAYICRDGFPVAYESVVLRAEESDFGMSVYSGSTHITSGGDSSVADMKSAIWRVVDDTRKQVETLTGESLREVYRERPVREHSLETDTEAANAELRQITHGGFPFSFEEVEIKVESDRAGLYVYSGGMLVAALAKGPSAYARVAEEIRDVVDATRVATERRGNCHAEAERLRAEAEFHEKRISALTAAGLPADDLVRIDQDMMESVKHTVRKAVFEANKGLDFIAAKGYTKAKLRVKTYSLGLVISAGGKECLVTRFPRVLNNKGLEKMLAYIRADIAALADSRKRYFATIRAALDTESALRRASRMLEEGERIAAAM